MITGGERIQTTSIVRTGTTAELVLTLSGDLDIGMVDPLESELQAVDGDRCGRVILDLANVEFIDSSGLRALLISQRELTQKGVELEIRHPRPQALRLFSLSGTGELLLGDTPDPETSDRR